MNEMKWWVEQKFNSNFLNLDEKGGVTFPIQNKMFYCSYKYSPLKAILSFIR